MRWSVLPLFALAGCPWIGATELDERLDADGDGYLSVAVGGVDCNDDDAEIRPDALERCNGIDDDCDGQSDEGTDEQVVGGQPYTLDADGDGFGQIGGAVVQACAAPEGFAPSADDCDDGDAAVRPGGDERCNGADDDCDGTVDEDPIDGDIRYLDADGDTYGDPDSGVAVCTNEGTVDNALDCDDTDATRHPDTSWYADADGDGYGNPARFVESSCEGPGGDAAANDRDCNDDDATLNPDTEWYADDDGDDYGGSVVATQCAPPPDALQVGGDCDDADPRVNPDTEWYEDADGDGFPGTVQSPPSCTAPVGAALDPSDCDDSNDAVSPDAVELCSTVGLDDDCDGFVDDDPDGIAPTDADLWFKDEDGDGWGTADETAFWCTPPDVTWSLLDGDCNDLRRTQHPDTVWILDADGDAHWPDAGTTVQQCDKPSDDHRELELVLGDPSDIDCDDAEPTTYPGADELCDTVDSDCDGDENDPDSTGERTYWRDDDGDGFGDSRFDRFACFPPSGYTDNPDDCDDDEVLAYPGAPDACYDGEDLDCDGDDEDDCDGDGFLPFADGGEDCDDLDPLVNPDLPTTRSVPGDHATIQEALDAACAYDTVQVASGTWVEALDAPRPVHLLGEGPASTVLSAPGLERVATWSGGTIEGLSMEGGFADFGACLYQLGGEPLTLRDVEFRDCTADSSGGGLYIQGVDFVVERVDFFDCVSAAAGGGMSFSAADGSLTDVSCTDCSGLSGGAVLLVGSVIDIDGLSLVRPTALGGVFQGSTVGGTWTDLTLEQPEALQAGLLLTGAGDPAPLVIDGLFVDRPATSDGGNAAVYAVPASDLTLTNVVVERGDIDTPIFPATVLDLMVSTGSIVVSGLRVQDVEAPTRLATTTPVGTILLEHGTFVEADGGLILDAHVADAITVRNTIVAYDAGRALTIDGALPRIEGTALYGNDGGDWPGGTPYLGSDSNVSVVPGFLSWGPSLVPVGWDLRLAPASLLRDAGVGLDPDGSPADIGAFGGPAVPVGALDDADGDGLYDSWELRFGLDPTSDSRTGDPDGDGLDNEGEANAGSWPDTPDTDGDGLDDGTEVGGGTSPVDASDP